MKKNVVDLVRTIPGWLSDHEGLFLLKASEYTKSLKGKVVEIGSFQGKSTIWLSQKNAEVVAIDPHEGKTDDEKHKPTLIAFRRHIKKAGVSKKIVVVVKKSQDAVVGWKEPIKLMFVDGLHDYKPVLNDYISWSPFLVEGGVIALHDAFCGWPGVAKVIQEEAMLDDRYKEIGVVGSIIYLIKGKKTVIDSINWWRSVSLINYSLWLNVQKWIPNKISFFLIHRVNKLLLLNRFTFSNFFK